ncbi:nuclear pore complex protein Nup58 [Drosophila montana]|uniref:nuclear pore complex protein Nup58 n=1 Tax=Drosophila montana TaxID=40370 RepID=UPI00313DED47
MSFSFGTPTTNPGLGVGAAAPATGAFSFGARPATSAPPPAFGAATATSSLAGAAGAVVGAAAPNFSFAPAASAAPTLSFGSQAAVAPAGTGLSLPSFGSTTSASPFGAASAAPAFGATNPAPAFGAASAAPAFGAFNAAPAFGTATATPTVGAPPGASAFGGPAATSAFGAPPTAAPAFGVPAAAPAFGAATATVAPSFNFSTPTSSAPTTAPPAFGSTAMPATLGAGVGAFSFNKPQATTAASLNFNTTTTTATAQPFNANLRLGGNNTMAPGGTGGIFGKPLTTGTQPTAAPPIFVGLGGIDVSATQPKLGDNKQDGIKIKETQVPDEIAKTVDALKSYIKQQKTISSDIGRTSTSKLSNVSHEITNLRWVLQNVANSVDANNRHIKQLRSETAKAIQSLEMAQRTQDTPAGLQFENSAPFQYFQCLVAKYEEDLIAFRQQILLTESHMHALANPQSISPDDLKRGFRQLNESFISLAGRLHELHQRVEEQKEHYLNLRRYRMRDATNVFAEIDNPAVQLLEPQRISSGPTPFSNISAMSTLNKSYAAASAATASNAAASK